MRLQSHYPSGRLVNHTVFGRQLRAAARRALTPHLQSHDFGFQDGGCAMFARALVLWSENRLCMAGYAPPRGRIQHVVANDGDLVLDSDGVATVLEGSRKLAIQEMTPGCALLDGYMPQAAPRIPWSEADSVAIARFLAPLLPAPSSLPWRQAA